MRFFACMLLIISALHAKDYQMSIEATAKEVLFNFWKENPKSEHFQVTPKVNVITGELQEEECDLVVAGHYPICFTRYYGQFSSYHPVTNFWRFNPEHCCYANFTYKESPKFLALGTAEGNICQFNCENNFHFDSKTGFVHTAPTGQCHPGNYIIHHRQSDFQNEGRYTTFRWRGEIIDGAGGIKKFASEPYHWNNRTCEPIRGAETLEYEVLEPDAWTPYQLPILEEKKPNGNIVVYEYDHYNEYGPQRTKFPHYSLLKSIALFDSTKTKVIGYIKFNYQRRETGHKHILGEIIGIKVEGSCGRKVNLKCGHTDVLIPHGSYMSYIEYAESTFSPRIHYIQDKTKRLDQSEGKRVKKIERPHGRYVETEYHKDTWKVIAQYAPIGDQGKRDILNSYVYHEDKTDVFDAEKNKTTYHFDKDKRITKIERFEKDTKLFRYDLFKVDDKTKDLKEHRIENGSGILVRQIVYDYDNFHNVIGETIGDDQGKYTIHRDFSKDGKNLLLTQWDDFGKKIVYTYKPGTNLCISEKTFENDVLKKKIVCDYDTAAICVRKVISDGDNKYCSITEIKPRYQLPCFGLPEERSEKTIDDQGKEKLLSRICYEYTPFGKVALEHHYDCNNQFLYTLENKYHTNECLSQSKDSLGYVTTYEYDDNLNLTVIVGPKKGQRKEIHYDKMNRPFCVKEYVDDQILCTEKTFDKLGRVTIVKDPCGKLTHFNYDALGNQISVIYPDYSYEKKEYDPLGNLLKVEDESHNVTIKSYDFHDKVKEIIHPDKVVEHFYYHPNGVLEKHHDRNGTITDYKSDIFGHTLEKVTYNPSHEIVLKKISQKWTAFSLLVDTDGEGIETHFAYDKAGRKMSEEKGGKKIEYLYDDCGRVGEIDDGMTIIKKSYDFKGNVIKEQVFAADKLLRTIECRYDALDYKTHIIMSKGVFRTEYNHLGMPILKVDPLGNLTTYHYEYKDGLRKYEKNPKGIETIVFYDGMGREKAVEVRNNQGDIIRHKERKYDGRGNIKREKNDHYDGTKLLKTTQINWFYGPGSRLERLLEEEGKETVYKYDNKGRLENTIRPDKSVLSHDYDDLGRLKRIKGKEIDYQYTYDGNDRVEEVKDSITGHHLKRKYDELGNVESDLCDQMQMRYVYDEKGQKKEMILPDGSTVHYAYEGDRLSKVIRKEFEHTYLERDLEGNITLAKLPAGLGKMIIDRDALGRWKEFTTKYYTAHFPEDAYDSLGNLKCFIFGDSTESHALEFEYDDLNQLVKEQNHTYRFDSEHYRLSKDGKNETCNELGQLEGEKYRYDLCGNMVEDGKFRYSYDAFDRLIKVEDGCQVIEYQYDAFNRRLCKKVNGAVSAYYLWEGDNEIGVMNAEGKIEELRVLGEGIGGEIGATVLIEMGDKVCVPISDHHGSIVVLIEMSGDIRQTTYTAFGEGNDVTPWGYCSKRKDECGLVYFGRRYYSPELGRWLTPDPGGFGDGSNLYAYVKNNPLTTIDIYGLEGILNDIFGWKQGYHEERDRCHHWCPEYEDRCREKSKNTDLGRPEDPRYRVAIICGIGNTDKDMQKTKEYVSDLIGGGNVWSLGHVTHGLLKDVYEAVSEFICGTMSTALINQYNFINDYLTENPENSLLLLPHSRGNIDYRNVARHLGESVRNRIHVVSIAPACYIDSDYCNCRHHFRTPGDFVTMFDVFGKNRNGDAITILPSDKFFDHSFRSSTYKEFISSHYQKFYEQYVEK